MLRNLEGQHSLWPAGIAVPAGWNVVQQPTSSRQHCLDYVNRNWTDMRPKSLIEASPTRDKATYADTSWF